MYIIKIKGKVKIPDYVQIRDDKFTLLAYFRADGRPGEIDFDFVDIPIPGDYLGAYVGVGYEWDFGPCNRWSHGPELQLLGGWEVSEGEFGFTPTARWGLTYRF